MSQCWGPERCSTLPKVAQQEGSARPGAQVSAIISASIHSSKWVDSCWFHSLTGCPGLVLLQLRVSLVEKGEGVWDRREEEKTESAS